MEGSHRTSLPPTPGQSDTNLVTGDQTIKELHTKQIEAHLRHIAFAVRKRGRDIVSQYNITPPQFEALLALDHHENLAMGELCQRLNVASSTITDLVDRMERAELAVRVRDPADRRVIRLQIQPKGREVINNVLTAWRTYLATLLDGMEAQDLEQLMKALGKMDRLLTSKEGAY